MAKGVEAFAAIGPAAGPDDAAADVPAELTTQALTNRLLVRVARSGGVELIVDAPDIVGERVPPHRASVVERRRHPGMAFDGQGLVEAEVGDAPAVVGARAAPVQAKRL